MEASIATEEMWTLTEDQKLVQMNLPPVLIEGVPKPVLVSLSFTAGSIDEMLERLTMLRAQMLPPPMRN